MRFLNSEDLNITAFPGSIETFADHNPVAGHTAVEEGMVA
jgi:hypothetical protein